MFKVGDRVKIDCTLLKRAKVISFSTLDGMLGTVVSNTSNLGMAHYKLPITIKMDSGATFDVNEYGSSVDVNDKKYPHVYPHSVTTTVSSSQVKDHTGHNVVMNYVLFQHFKFCRDCREEVL